MVNLGTKIRGGEIKPPPALSKTEGKSLFKPMTDVGVCLITILFALSAVVAARSSYRLRDRVDDYFCATGKQLEDVTNSLVSMHQILDVNGIIVPQSNKAPVRFLVVVENGNVVGMYESKGGVISTIQTNQFEVLRK